MGARSHSHLGLSAAALVSGATRFGEPHFALQYTAKEQTSAPCNPRTRAHTGEARVQGQPHTTIPSTILQKQTTQMDQSCTLVIIYLAHESPGSDPQYGGKTTKQLRGYFFAASYDELLSKPQMRPELAGTFCDCVKSTLCCSYEHFWEYWPSIVGLDCWSEGSHVSSWSRGLSLPSCMGYYSGEFSFSFGPLVLVATYSTAAFGNP